MLLQACGAIGSNFRMAVENSVTTGEFPPATFSATSKRFEILNENMRYTDVVVGSRGLTGSLDPIANHLRSGARLAFGRVVMEVGPNELAYWLPRILGGADASGTSFSTAETFAQRPVDLMFDREAGVVVYRHCLVNRCLFQGRSATQDDPDAQVLRMMLDFVGIEEHTRDSEGGLIEWPETGPTLPSTQRLYWLFGDSKLELDIDSTATEFTMDAFNLLIDNKMTIKTRNNLTAVCLRSMGRDIRLQMPTPYTATSHLNLYVNRFDGPGRILFRGTKNLTGLDEEDFQTDFEFARLFQVRETPNVRGMTEIPLSLDMTAYRTSSAEPLEVTNIITAA